MTIALAAPWPLFEVSVEGYDPTIVTARSRGAAIYDKFLDYAEVWPDITFRQWLSIARARRAQSATPPGDPYAYVRSYYDRDLRHGTRVMIQGEGPDLNGKLGTVVHPNRATTAYAHVVVDGTDHTICIHPLSTVVQP